MNQRFRAHVIVGRLMVGNRGASHPRLTHAFIGHQLLAFPLWDLITDLRAGFVFVEIQLMHRTHAVFVIIDGLRLYRIVRAS